MVGGDPAGPSPMYFRGRGGLSIDVTGCDNVDRAAAESPKSPLTKLVVDDILWACTDVGMGMGLPAHELQTNLSVGHQGANCGVHLLDYGSELVPLVVEVTR